jgi:hypothetical protein
MLRLARSPSASKSSNAGRCNENDSRRLWRAGVRGHVRVYRLESGDELPAGYCRYLHLAVSMIERRHRERRELVRRLHQRRKKYPFRRHGEEKGMDRRQTSPRRNLNRQRRKP